MGVNRLGIVTYNYKGTVYRATIKTANFILSHDGILFNRVSVWIKHIKSLNRNTLVSSDELILYNPILQLRTISAVHVQIEPDPYKYGKNQRPLK